MARIDRLRVFPVKGLDGVSVDAAPVTPAGTLAGDREYALCPPDAPAMDGDGDTVTDTINGKDAAGIHALDAGFDPETHHLRVDGDRFDLRTPGGRERAGEVLSGALGVEAELRRRDPPGFADRPDAGPTVVSTATLRTVADWFDGLTPDGVRRRLRTNVEVAGVPAFWEDRFVGRDERFRAGSVEFHAVEPCARCVVPSRDPDTGEPLPAFRERFVERRAATFPDFADRSAFPHDYTLTLVAGVTAGHGETVAVGDPVRVVEGS